jgi:hypothetical protein
VSKEHGYETEAGLSICQDVSVRWRQLPPISVDDMFSRLLQTLITRKRLELSIDFSSKSAKIIVKKIKQFLTVSKGHHYRVVTLRKKQIIVAVRKAS